MNARQIKKAIRQLDQRTFDAWADTPNGSARLQAIYQSVDDMDDSLQGIASAVYDGHQQEALALIQLARASISDHIETLKGLL